MRLIRRIGQRWLSLVAIFVASIPEWFRQFKFVEDLVKRLEGAGALGKILSTGWLWHVALLIGAVYLLLRDFDKRARATFVEQRLLPDLTQDLRLAQRRTEEITADLAVINVLVVSRPQIDPLITGLHQRWEAIRTIAEDPASDWTDHTILQNWNFVCNRYEQAERGLQEMMHRLFNRTWAIGPPPSYQWLDHEQIRNETARARYRTLIGHYQLQQTQLEAFAKYADQRLQESTRRITPLASLQG